MNGLKPNKYSILTKSNYNKNLLKTLAKLQFFIEITSFYPYKSIFIGFSYKIINLKPLIRQRENIIHRFQTKETTQSGLKDKK